MLLMCAEDSPGSHDLYLPLFTGWMNEVAAVATIDHVLRAHI